MSQRINTHQLASATYNANGNSAALPNESLYEAPEKMVLLVNVGSAPTGTTPTLTVSIDVSPDGGTTWFPSGLTTTALNAAGQYRVVGSDLIEGTYRVKWVVGGTTPSFTNVTIWVVFQ